MGTKKIPMRMCTACREMKPKRELIRVVKTSDGEIKLDTTGKLGGRGAYICSKCKTSEDLLKKRVLDRAFRMHVPDEIYDLLKGE